MKTVYGIILVAAAIAPAARAISAESPEAVAKDRAVYTRLVKELREDHASLSGAYKTAVVQARANDGKVPQKTRADILALRERIDRKNVRLMLLAGRHGWDVPEFSIIEIAADSPPAPSDAEQLLPADPLITEALVEQARRLAGRIRLPVISVAAGRK